MLRLLLLIAAVLGQARPEPEVRQVLPTGKYFVNIEPLSWLDAYQACKARGSQLAVINSQLEADLVAKMLGDYIDLIEEPEFHVGVHGLFDPDTFVTIHGDKVSETGYSKWVFLFPMPGAPYGTFQVDKIDPEKTGLAGVGKEANRSSVCEDKLWGDYDLIPEVGYYKYYNDTPAASWLEAWATCHAEGAALWIVHSPEELAAVHAEYQYGRVWVGVHRLFNSKDYVTIFDDHMANVGYNEWSHQIVDDERFPYASAEGVRGLNSEKEDPKLAFVCEHFLY